MAARHVREREQPVRPVDHDEAVVRVRRAHENVSEQRLDLAVDADAGVVENADQRRQRLAHVRARVILVVVAQNFEEQPD